MYYIYEIETTYIMGKPDRNGVTRPDHRKSYKTLGAAEAALTQNLQSRRPVTYRSKLWSLPLWYRSQCNVPSKR